MTGHQARPLAYITLDEYDQAASGFMHPATSARVASLKAGQAAAAHACGPACADRYRAAHEPGSDYQGVRCGGGADWHAECAVWWLRPGAAWNGKSAHTVPQAVS